MGSQLDQESFNDHTLTYCILKDLEGVQRLVTSPKVVDRDGDDDTRIEDDILEKEDDRDVDGRRPSMVDDQMMNKVGDTNTSLTEAGVTGQRETILRQDGEVGKRCTRTNSSTSLEDPSDVVPVMGTTVDLVDMTKLANFVKEYILVKARAPRVPLLGLVLRMMTNVILGLERRDNRLM